MIVKPNTPTADKLSPDGAFGGNAVNMIVNAEKEGFHLPAETYTHTYIHAYIHARIHTQAYIHAYIIQEHKSIQTGTLRRAVRLTSPALFACGSARLNARMHAVTVAKNGRPPDP